MANPLVPFYFPTKNGINSTTYPCDVFYSSSAVDFPMIARSGDYIFLESRGTYGVSEYLKRINYATGSEISINIISALNPLNSQALGYFAASDNLGVLVTSTYSNVIQYYEINWNSSAVTYLNQFDFNFYYTPFISGLCGIDNNGNLKIVVNVLLKEFLTGFYRSSLIVYDRQVNNVSTVYGPYAIDDNYDVLLDYDVDSFYFNIIKHADLGDGNIGFIYVSRTSSARSYFCILDTNTNLLTSLTIPSLISVPSQLGDYKYSQFSSALSPNYSDNSLYIQLNYEEMINTTAYYDFNGVRILNFKKSGSLSLVSEIGDRNNPDEYIGSRDLLYSKTKTLSYTYKSNLSGDNYLFYDFNTFQQFTIPTSTTVYPAKELDDGSDHIYWVRESTERDFSDQYYSNPSVSQEIVGKKYTEGWDWSGWDITPATVDISTLTIGGTTYGPAIHFRAKSSTRGYTPIGSPIWTGSDDSTVGGGVQITGITSGSLYMVTATGKFNKNTSLVPPYYATTSMMYYNSFPTETPETGYDGWGGTSYGEVFASPYTSTNVVKFIDNNGTPVDGIVSPRFFFVADTLYTRIGNADNPGYRGDNSGLISYAAYRAAIPKLEMGMSVPVSGTAYTNMVISISVKEVPVIYPHGGGTIPFFLRSVYTDGSYTETTTASFGATNLTIPPSDNGKTFSKIVFGYYLDTYHDYYDINMIVTNLTVTLANSIIVEKVNISGTTTPVLLLGNITRPKYLRLAGYTIDYIRGTFHAIMRFKQQIIPTLKRFQAIFWN